MIEKRILSHISLVFLLHQNQKYHSSHSIHVFKFFCFFFGAIFYISVLLFKFLPFVKFS